MSGHACSKFTSFSGSFWLPLLSHANYFMYQHRQKGLENEANLPYVHPPPPPPPPHTHTNSHTLTFNTPYPALPLCPADPPRAPPYSVPGSRRPFGALCCRRGIGSPLWERTLPRLPSRCHSHCWQPSGFKGQLVIGWGEVVVCQTLLAPMQEQGSLLLPLQTKDIAQRVLLMGKQLNL